MSLFLFSVISGRRSGWGILLRCEDSQEGSCSQGFEVGPGVNLVPTCPLQVSICRWPTFALRPAHQQFTLSRCGPCTSHMFLLLSIVPALTAQMFTTKTPARDGSQTSCALGGQVDFLGLFSLQKAFSQLVLAFSGPKNDMVVLFAAAESLCSRFIYTHCVIVGDFPKWVNSHCYFERNFSNSEKALKPDGCHGPGWGRWHERKTESQGVSRDWR